MQALRNKRCWIFDMDGTLTHAVHDFDAIRATLGLPESIPILESIAALPEAEAVHVRSELDALELEIAYQSTAQPGARLLLEALKRRGHSLGILTRNGRAIADATLQACALADLFEAPDILSRDCCAPKPNPAGILKLLQRWQATAEDCVMVGDYHFDLEAGRRAAVTTVHLDVHGTFPWPELTDASVTSLATLHAVIEDSGTPLPDGLPL